MGKRELEKLLKTHGYTPERLARHGWFWVKGKHRILVARESSFEDRRALKNVLSVLRKQLKTEVAG